MKKSTTAFSGSSGIVCEPLSGSGSVRHRSDTRFESASLVKLPILVELARRIEAGEVHAEDPMIFEERFRVEGSGVLKKRPAGGKYSLQQLAEWMITQSDNVATDMLLERLGMNTVEDAMERLGLRNTTVQRTIFDFGAIDRGRDNLISAADAATLLRGIGEGRLPRSEWMLEILTHTKRHDLIQKRLPSDLRVAHKTGQLQGVLHDAALVFLPEQAYVLVVLTQGAPEAEAEKFIQELSADVYHELAAKENPGE